jgi:predicted DNA-binding transcriptional regulator YafY
MIWKDEIVEEVRKVADAYAAQFDYDLKRMFEDIKKKEAQEDPARFAKIKPVKHTEIYELLRTAIQEKRLIELVYNEKRRIVEPHDYGIHNGSEKLLAYQVAGSSTGKLPNWRWMEIDQMMDLRLLERKFRGGRPDASSRHNEWDQLFFRVEPADDGDE